MFGFTNDKAIYDKVIQFRDDMIADKWQYRPTYPSYESQDRAMTLNKDGFTAMILTRTNIGSWKYEAAISIWASDKLSIVIPDKYSMQALLDGIHTCGNCGKTGVETFRYCFAGRCCKECLPAMQEKYEQPGWTR